MAKPALTDDNERGESERRMTERKVETGEAKRK